MKKLYFILSLCLISLVANAAGTHQYAVADIAQLKTDLAAGTYDIYELTESATYAITGGAATNLTIGGSITNITIRAAAGLTTKPIVKLTANSTTSQTVSILNSTLNSLTLTFSGIEFNGISTGTSTYQPVLYYATGTNNMIYVSNCYIHDFTNNYTSNSSTNGGNNGIMRFDGAGTSLDVQGSIVDKCAGRGFLFYTAPAAYGSINFKNNTLSNTLTGSGTTSLSSSIIFCRSSSGNKATNTNISIDHCTFYSGTAASQMLTIQQVTGNLSITNCIFDAMGSGSNSTFSTSVTGTTTINKCYLAGFSTPPTGTNTFTANSPAPAYDGAATLNFGLSNKSSFVGSDALYAGNTSTYLTAPNVSTGATLPTSNGFTANWATVSNASNYDVYVYTSPGGVLAGSSPYRASGQATSSKIISDLSSSSKYTYKVISLGNQTNFSNSDLSTSSAEITTTSSGLTKLTSPTNLSSGSISTTGFKASWDAVSFASKYTVKIYTYPGGVQVGSNYTNISTTYYDVSSLTANTAYTFSVTAIGDGTSYSDSDPTLSANFSTLALTPLSTPTVNAPSAYLATGFTASWNTVANALSYDVRLYQNGILVSGYPKNASGQSTASYAITGLTAGLSYSYTVTALGDNVSAYSNSAESTASSAYTTGTPSVGAYDIRSTGFTAGWSITSSATNYIVKLYQGGDLVITTSAIALSGSGNTASPSYVFAGLTPGIPYTYTVTTSDNFVSSESSVTTANPTILENFGDWKAHGLSMALDTTKVINDGTIGNFKSSLNFVVAPTQSIGTPGAAMGNSRPTVGRIQLSATNAYIQTPVVQNISTLMIKTYVGTAGTFKIQSSTDGSSFGDVAGTTNTLSSTVTNEYTINLNYNTPKYFRIVSNQGSSVYINDLQVNPYISSNKLATPTVGTATNPTTLGFTANWTPVSNATGYVVKLYQGSNVVNIYSVSGQSTSSLVIRDLNYSTTYAYKIMAVGDVVTNAASDASTLSSTVTTYAPISAINTIFNDGTWGSVLSSQTLGNYPSSYVNGFDLIHAYIQSGTTTGPKGEVHTNTLRLDKTLNSGVLNFPVVASVAQFEIHASATAGRQYLIQSSTDGGTTWNAVGPGNRGTAGTYYNNTATDGQTGTEQIDIIPTGGLTNAKFRITNPSGGAFTFYEIITRTTTPAILSAPTVGTASNVTATGFTANWTPIDNNASGYKVFVYQGSTLVSGFPVSVTGQSTSSLAITGLISNTTYTYNVMSSGDGDINYSNSNLSAASGSFPTLPPAPAISSFTPTSAGNGTSVVITGTNFTGASAVSFGGTSATSYTVDSDTQITAVVSFGTTGSVSVTTPSGTGTKTGFTWFAPVTTVTDTQSATGLSLNSSSIVSISSGGTLNIDQNTSATSITVQPGGKLTLADGKTLSSTVTLQNTSSASASFVDSSVSDTPPVVAATVNQDISATDRNWYVSVPVSGKTTSALTFGASIVSRDEPNAGWTTLAIGANLVPGVGYISTASTGGTATWNISGNLNSGLVQVPVTCSGTTYTGFNLLGNPYPSYLNWSAVLNLNSTNAAILQPTIWYRTKSGGSYTFQTYNATGDIATPKTASGYIPPMQAFWVRANAGGGTVTLNNAMRSHGDGSANMLKARSVNNAIQPVLRLEVQNMATSNTDEAVVYFNSNASNGYDAFDSQKMSNNSASFPEIYTLAGTEKVVINGLNTVTPDQEIALGFTTGQSNVFAIKATEIGNFSANTKIILKDNVLDNQQELTDGAAYNFTSDVTTDNTSRFSVIFKTSSVTTGTENATDNSILVYRNITNQITVNCSPVILGNATVSVYNAVGQKLENRILTNATTVINKSLNAGVYLVTVVANGKTATQKVVIN